MLENEEEISRVGGMCVQSQRTDSLEWMLCLVSDIFTIWGGLQ